MRCPYCSHTKSWSVRRCSRKCKACRREWVPGKQFVSGIRATEKEWQQFLLCFLRYKTVAGIRLHAELSHLTVLKMSARVRSAMSRDLPEWFAGVVEADETYIGTWQNKRWQVRKHGTKRGRGTSKQPVFGLFGRDGMQVRGWLVPNTQTHTLRALIQKHVERGSTLYSDGYPFYRKTPRYGYEHDFVDHNKNEYARGDVSTNCMEGFWGLLKKRLRATGGIRRERLQAYVDEECWRYNHLGWTETKKIQRLLDLLCG